MTKEGKIHLIKEDFRVITAGMALKRSQVCLILMSQTSELRSYAMKLPTFWRRRGRWVSGKIPVEREIS